MSVFDIKIIAIVAMIIDHVGMFFFPHALLFRVIGRLSFPLFAWLIANGARYSRDINAYLKRLLIFAFISQIPFVLARRQIDPAFWYLNVLFTLFLGLLAIKFIRQTNNKWMWFLSILLCLSAAHFLKTDFGILGVLSIVLFYLFYNDIKYMFMSQIMLYLAIPLLIYFIGFYNISLPSYLNSYIEPIGLFSLMFIALYNKKEGIKAKYLFYIIYPLQFVIFFLLKALF